MVAVIEAKEEAGQGLCIEFNVHRSRTAPDRVLGGWRLAGADGAVVEESRPDGPVRIEFRHALDCADRHGIPYLWVNDPEELFPYYDRR